MKKVKTSWSNCPQCERILSNRFIKRHEKDHATKGGVQSLAGSCLDPGDTPQPVKSVSASCHAGDSSLKQSSASSHEYGFFSGGNLYAVVTTKALEMEPQLPKTVRDHIVFLSPGTMRVGKIAIGEPIVINEKYSYLAWPNLSVPDCFVYIQSNTRIKQASPFLTSGSLCTINSLQNVPHAHHVRIKIQEGLSTLPSSVKSEELTSFVKQQLYMRITSPGCGMTVKYFGKPINVHIVEVITKDHVIQDGDSLCENMDNLEISLTNRTADTSLTNASQITSTPVSTRTRSRKTTPDHSSASPAPSIVQLDEGLNCASGQFYQITQSTVVTLSDQVSEGALSEESTCSEVTDPVSVLAGVDDVLEKLNQLIIEPISKRKMYDQYGVHVPRGALLHGPSGCGKTLIANAISKQLKGHAEFIPLDSTQLWSKQFGETENRLQQIFQQAVDSSPSVIFIDDIDVMCPRRERSQSDLEKRVLSTLVSEIDKVTQHSTSYVFILATTNKLDSVDMSLRRPGRIDSELEVPVPSSSQREQIIGSLLKTMLHRLSPESIAEIAADCHGYVGADLQSLCRVAGLNAMRRMESISMEDFKHAMSTVQPSAMREIYIDVPKVRWTDIGGQGHLKQSLVQAIIWPLQHADRFKKLGIKPPRGVLMYGPPGCSKTMIAKALATETSLNFISIKGPELFSKWVGESEKAVREVFRKARNAAPSIIFFDEIDAVAVERGRQQSSGGGVGDRVLAQLLTELDGVEGLNNVNIVAATNRPDMIDKALMRPGRLDRLVYVPLPDEKTREDIFRLRLSSVPLADDVSYEELVRKTRMFSGAEIVALCNEAALTAMQEDLEVELIKKVHFDKAITCINPQTTEAMVKHYEDYAAGAKT